MTTHYTGDTLDDLDEEALQALTDSQLYSIAESAIYDAALMASSHFYHDRVDRVYAECQRRSRGIYQRAWNAAVRSEGHHGMAREVDPDGP